ncbi:DUF1707 and DUF4190 domain-containing protein [Peterkaempfera bronchialis]|uniref:DUF1707 and DUF4190 domain-containing protein n=2 Tax=Peterkaempfera bronchialis TaxID=2126346 RepID=A0A345SWE0_9ACTN|nr:DUF1707 and DUF4190 domain-containing protein [Peterkaempfera bronchialis]
MRAAHTDRDRTVDVLKAAYAEGRLTPDEYGQRVEAAYRALTYGELAGLVRDLPSGPMVQPTVQQVPPSFMPPQTFGPPVAFMPPPPRAVPPTNSMAVASLVLSLLGFMPFGIASVPAAILGHIAKTQIRSSGEQGDGMATTGVVLGWLGIAFWLMILVIAAGT